MNIGSLSLLFIFWTLSKYLFMASYIVTYLLLTYFLLRFVSVITSSNCKKDFDSPLKHHWADHQQFQFVLIRFCRDHCAILINNSWELHSRTHSQFILSCIVTSEDCNSAMFLLQSLHINRYSISAALVLLFCRRSSPLLFLTNNY